MAVRGRLCVDLRIDVMRAAELVLRGAEERLAPIVMTALVRGLALVPIVVGAGRSAQEVDHPMPVVILRGLFTSTVLNLFLLPS